MRQRREGEMRETREKSEGIEERERREENRGRGRGREKDKKEGEERRGR
jgi:hypothetical protein